MISDPHAYDPIPWSHSPLDDWLLIALVFVIVYLMAHGLRTLIANLTEDR